MRFLSRLFAVSLATLVAGMPAWAIEPGDMTQLEGKTLAGQPFRLDALRGKVVLVLFWSTDCAVCRDKMPELRANVRGWAGKPFEMVTVSADRRVQDTLDYERIVTSLVPGKERFASLWMGEASYKDNFGRQTHLPSSYLLDKTGRVHERYIGRIPPEAWDKIADLM